MLIRNTHAQKILFGLSLIACIGLIILTLLHAPFIAMLDNLSAQLHMSQLPHSIQLIWHLVAFFNQGFGALFVIFCLAYFLWGFKYKLPAFWVVCTSLFGGLSLHLLDWLIPATHLHQAVQFPAFAIFWASLIYSFFNIFILPELNHFFSRIGLQCLLCMIWLFIFIGSLFQTHVLMSGILFGWSFALVILELFEMLYVHYAPFFARMNGFHNSWY
ncbi:hypothetical protein JOC36_001382 [Weissella uvarum]|uniref:hypothetical protein n=1 Tax=Weissella uvarum TaxID=1479233 RepID=UPI0019608628|nr:hypothetical protein [Weissella uvarum]MBM7617805.1 hypothetical protein [Weissella uvarum]MCM0595816.1 hypothetical protein [Weissella uvarum]